QRRALDAAMVAQAFVAQAEPVQRVDLAGKQAVAGQTELDEVVQHRLAEAVLGAILPQTAVLQEAVLLAHVTDRQRPAFVMGDAVARAEADAGQWGSAQRVMAGLAAGREQQDNQTAIL